MDARKVLGVSENANFTEIKKAYHKLALQWHPDKNKSPEAKDKFREINDAYKSLSKQDAVPPLFGDLVVDAIRWLLSESPVLTDEIIGRIKEMLAQYADVVTPLMREYFLSKLKPVRVLRPTLNDLMNQKVYLHEEKYTIPTWHHELEFDNTVFKCVPSLPENITINASNELTVQISASLHETYVAGQLCVNVGDRQLLCSASCLKLVPTQTVTFYGVGVPKINTQDVLDTSTLENVHVSITFI